jgi:hypothetical protein
MSEFVKTVSGKTNLSTYGLKNNGTNITSIPNFEYYECII